MKLEGTHVFDAPRQRVWEVLNDAQLLQRHMPGCERLTPVGPDEYEAVLTIGVALIKGTYVAKVRLTDKEPPAGYTLHVEGSGKPGFVKGEGRVTLTEQGDKTELHYTGDLQIGGILAGIGQRMMSGVAGRMTRQFFLDIGAEASA